MVVEPTRVRNVDRDRVDTASSVFTCREQSVDLGVPLRTEQLDAPCSYRVVVERIAVHDPAKLKQLEQTNGSEALMRGMPHLKRDVSRVARHSLVLVVPDQTPTRAGIERGQLRIIKCRDAFLAFLFSNPNAR